MLKLKKYISIFIIFSFLVRPFSSFADISGIVTEINVASPSDKVEIIDSGFCGNDVTFTLYKNGVLFISGEGEMENYSYNTSPLNFKYEPDAYKTPWLNNKKYIIDIIIDDGITNIGDFSFFECQNLESITLPESIETIGYYAFYNCKKLANIEFSNTAIEVKNFAFYGCEQLINSNLENIEAYNECAFDFSGNNKSSATISKQRMESIIDYLDKVYLDSNNNIGFDFYNVSPGDKEVFQAIVDDITSDCITDEERVDAIGSFAEYVLSYNTSSIYSDFTCDVLRHLKGVCAGHNQFVSTLLKCAGYPTAIISGIKCSGNFTFDYILNHPRDHQWCMTYYDDEWHIIDVTNNYTNNTIDKYTVFMGFLVDGVLPITENEDIYTYSQLKTFVKLYINNNFTSNYKFNGFNFWAAKSIINNGAIWSSYIRTIDENYTFSIEPITNKYFSYDSCRENGCKIVGVYPSIDDNYYFWGQIEGLSISEELAYMPFYNGNYILVKGQTISIFSDDILTDPNLSIKVGKSNLAEINADNSITLTNAGKTYIAIVKNNIEQYTTIPVIIVNSISEIPTNNLIKNYCKHHFTFNNYCTYCGEKVDESINENKTENTDNITSEIKEEKETADEFNKEEVINNENSESESNAEEIITENKESNISDELPTNKEELNLNDDTEVSINNKESSNNSEINNDNEEITINDDIIRDEESISSKTSEADTIEPTNEEKISNNDIIEPANEEITDEEIISNDVSQVDTIEPADKEIVNEEIISDDNTQDESDELVEIINNTSEEVEIQPKTDSTEISDNTKEEPISNTDMDHIEDQINNEQIELEPQVEIPAKDANQPAIKEQSDKKQQHTINNNNNSGGNGGSNSNSIKAKSLEINYWINDGINWKVFNPITNTYIASTWLCDNYYVPNAKNIWYLFDENGNMINHGLIKDENGNFYSIETNHNGYYGMLRATNGYYMCDGKNIYLEFNSDHNGSFGAITNPEGVAELLKLYAPKNIKINNNCIFTAEFK